MFNLKAQHSATQNIKKTLTDTYQNKFQTKENIRYINKLFLKNSKKGLQITCRRPRIITSHFSRASTGCKKAVVIFLSWEEKILTKLCPAK